MTEWLLMKRGLYYRPEDCGYTGIRDHAGRYTEEQALARCGNGVTAISLRDAPEFTEACFDDLAREHLKKQRDEARAALADEREACAQIVEACTRSDVERTALRAMAAEIRARPLTTGKCEP